MLVYDQPINQAGPERPTTPPAPAGFSVMELSRLMWQRRVAIALAALIGACAAVAIGKVLTPKYVATAQLYVDPRQLQLVDRELTPRSQDISGLAMVVESQARLITSNSVLLQVVQNTHLDKDPEFGGASRGGVAALLGWFGIESRPAGNAKLGEIAALEALSRHINVKKPDRSFIIDIELWSHDPAKAAMLANAIAEAYLAESKKSQAAAARRATADLSGRLKELQQRLRKAENALAVYKAENNFVGTQDTLLSDQQLSAGNQRLAAAHALTLDAQARYDQIEASRRNSTDAGAIPEALQSPTIANLRAQYAEARKRYAELAAELGPLHPSLRQMEQQVEDLRRNVNEEVARFAQSAKNDLTRARDYEASLNKSLDAQKRQSVRLSQASVRLRELERDVEANRDVYQSFLKRSRETEEQESLNTSSARVIGDATIPQRRSFPPAMSLLAGVGLVLGALAAAAWFVAASRLPPDTSEPQPVDAPTKSPATAAKPPTDPEPRPQEPEPPAEKPLIARLQESDVVRTLGGVLATSAIPDLTQIGWPTLRAGLPVPAFRTAMAAMRAAMTRRSPTAAMPVMAMIGAGAAEDRSIAALNIALAAARDGARVLMIGVDQAARALPNKVNAPSQSKTGRFAWLRAGSQASPVIETANRISVLPVSAGSGAKASEGICRAVAQARAAGGYDLVLLDGPPMPWSAADRKLLDTADGLVAILPVSLDINECLEDIITALGGAERKLIGVVLNELSPAAVNPRRDKQYA